MEFLRHFVVLIHLVGFALLALDAAGRALVDLLPRIASVEGVERIRVSYLQPAELRPDLLRTIATTPGVAPYFDLSFQHSSATVLRRMRRFGGTAEFIDLVTRIRQLDPDAGIRSNVIVGFPLDSLALASFSAADAVALGLLATDRAIEAGLPIVIEVDHLGRADDEVLKVLVGHGDGEALVGVVGVDDDHAIPTPPHLAQPLVGVGAGLPLGIGLNDLL